MEQDFLQCEVTSDTSYQIGDKIHGAGIEFQVAGIRGRLKNGEIRYTYQLVQKDGVQVMELKNPYLQGSAFTGTILTVGRNQVKIHLDIDESQEEAAVGEGCERVHWFSLDMPLIDDQCCHVMFFREMKGGALMGTFDCSRDGKKQWKSILKQILATIREDIQTDEDGDSVS